MAYVREAAQSAVIPSINPATLEEIGRVPLMSETEVESAVFRALKACQTWGRMPLAERAEHLRQANDYMLDHADELIETISKEQGKPRIEALVADLFTVADLIAYWSKKAEEVLQPQDIPLHFLPFPKVKRSRLVYEPLGVVAVISPWNFPFALPMSGIVFALLTGNTVVFKPASDVPLVAQKIHEILTRGGNLPEGALEMVTTSGATAQRVLCRPPIKKVVFTGSTEVGKRIMEACGRHLIPVVLELGGKDPMVVLDDVDLDLAARGAVWGAFTNCGQVCASIERVYVHKKIAQPFIEKVVAETKKMRVGAYTSNQVEMGPMVSEGQRQTVEDHVKDAVAKGAKILHGGRRPEGKGYFYEPTVLTDVNHGMKCIREETFGPLLPIMTFETEDEAVTLANDSNYGLTASVWGKDRKRAEAVAARIDAGTVCVNDHAYTYGLTDTPWQGMKESGLGASHSRIGMMEFVYPKHLHLDYLPNWIRTRPWWYPYDAKKFAIFKNGMQLLFRRGARHRLSALGRVVGALSGKA
ncbi:MAG: aldehyde dehydrogenase family protein [Nitrospirae bacterium]|nr:aldehyde dehydrogenase family protein [Nitrospirota bacterium]